MTKDTLSFKVEVRWIFLFLSAIAAVGFIVFKFWYIDNKKPFGIQEIMAYAAGSVAILTLLYHAFSLEYTRNFNQETILLQRHQYTYDIISKINGFEMSRALNTYSWIKNNKAILFKDNNVQPFLDQLESEEERTRQLHVVMLLNYFEHLSILVENKYIDEDIVKQAFKTLFVGSYSIMKPYIEFKQASSRQAWYHFECLAKKWSEGK
jgi:hypothetical protein